MKATRIFFSFCLFSLLMSCSTDSDESNENQELIENIEIISMDPNYGYPGDEITYQLSDNIPSNADVTVTYGENHASVINKSGSSVTHVIPEENQGQIKLNINGREINVDQFYKLKQIFECQHCYETVLSFNNDESAIIGAYEINNITYAVKVSQTNDFKYLTSLVKFTDDLELLEEIELFNSKPISKIIFNQNSFVLSNESGVYSYNYDGVEIWNYQAETYGGLGSNYFGYVIPHVIKSGEFYYFIKNPVTTTYDGDDPMEVVKLNSSGQLEKSFIFRIDEDSDNEMLTATFLEEVDNKIIVFTTYCCDYQRPDGYIIIDKNDNILRVADNYVSMRDTDLFTEGNAMYYKAENYSGTYTFYKATINSENYITDEWSKAPIGVILKYNQNYIVGYQDRVQNFNNNSFTSPQTIMATSVNLEQVSIEGYNIVGESIYFYGRRTLEYANDYRAFIGKYSLGELIQ